MDAGFEWMLWIASAKGSMPKCMRSAITMDTPRGPKYSIGQRKAYGVSGMRSIVFLILALIGNTLFAQVDTRDSLIAQLRAEIAALKAEIVSMRQPIVESKIVMESIPGCEACERWWASERIELIRAKWVVERVLVNPARGRLYPRWRVCIGDSCQEIENTRTIIPRLRQIVESRKPRWELFE